MRAFDVGQRFGRLTVVARLQGKPLRAEVKCDCGTVRVVFTNNLTRGATTSCGCYRRQRSRECNAGHGLTETSEYASWNAAKGRCGNPRNKAYQSYGGRGIYMCSRWQESFESFLSDMGPRPEGTSLDRIDNDGPYSPENCRWATRAEQANNRRSSRFVTAFGRSQTISRWSAETGIPYDVIKQRTTKLGWDAERALSAPVRRWPSQEASA